MKTLKYFLLTVFSLSMAFSCAKLENLSNDNSIIGLTISEHRPRAIEIDQPTYSGDTIYIPVVYGKYDFPLYFRANLEVDSNVDKVMGIDFSRELSLASMDDELKFFVMAKSGKTRVYIIKAKEIPLEENADIFADVEITSTDPNAAFSPVRYKIGDTIRLSGVDLNYPVRITPKFHLAEGAEFRNFDNGTTALVFQSPSTVQRLKVVSQSGAERIWNIKLSNLPLINNSTPGVDGTTTSIDPRKLTVALTESTIEGGLQIDETYVDNKTNTIQIVVDSKTAMAARMSKSSSSKARIASVPGSGIGVLLTFPIYENIGLSGYTEGTPLDFEAFDTPKDFYIFDPVAKVARKWSVTVVPYRQNQANVTKFAFTYTAAGVKTSKNGAKNVPSIVLNPSFIDVYPNDGKIFIKATSIAAEYYTDGFLGIGSQYNYDWKLTLKPTLTLSKGATTDAPAEFVWISNLTPGILGIGTKANDCWTEPKMFEVVAEDGTVKQWSITILEPNQSIVGTMSELLDFGIAKLTPNYAVLDNTTPIIRDEDSKTLTIKLSDAKGVFPLTVYPTYKVSQYASITSPMPLTFETAEDVKELVVTSQNGQSTSTWKVKLLVPVEAEGADVEKFDVTSITEQFKLNKTVINKENALVTIFLDSDGKYPLNVGYRLTLSDGATLEGSNAIGTLTFNAARETKSIVVKAENGVEKLWVFKLDYRPQLTNADLNSWKDSETLNPDKYWATANNSLVTGTTRSTGFSGQSGDYAPLMSTSSTAGKLAAGTTFTGYFVFDSGIGMSDPVQLTYQGIPFAPAAKIKAVELDVKYSPSGNDLGSVVAELIYWDGKGNYIYHGDKPSKVSDSQYTAAPHSMNTAVSVAKKQIILGMNAGTSKFGTPITAVPRDTWTKITIEMPYGNNPMPTFTHFNFICGSSVYGDLFIGEVGSKLQVDNIKIIYED